MKNRKVMALLLSIALSISTCVPLGSITALGAENASTAEAAAVQVDDSSSEETAETVEEADSSSEAATVEEEKADDNDEVLPENSQEEAIPNEEVEAAGETEETDSETVDAEDSDETEASLPALETEPSEAESEAADKEGEPAASDETPETAAETPAEGNPVITAPAETETVKTDAQNELLEDGLNRETNGEKEIEIFVITFDANGGYFAGEEHDDVKQVNVNDATVIQRNFQNEDRIAWGSVAPETPVSMDGNSIFAGWSREKDGEAEKYWNVYIDKDTTLYAIWKKGFTVTYDANGGYFGNDENRTDIETETVLENEVISPPSDVSIDDPHKLFMGWSLEKDGLPLEQREKAYYMHYTFSPTDNCTLYAVWSDAITVTIDATDGYFALGSLADLIQQTIINKVRRGSKISLYADEIRNDDPEKVLAGWSFNRNGDLIDTDDSIDWYGEKHSYYSPQEDCTIYAVWAKGCTVSFDANGGMIETFDDENDEWINKNRVDVKGAENGLVYLPDEDSLIAPSKNKGFAGWSLTKNGSTVTKIGDKNYKASQTTTLYAVWKDTCTITLDGNGGLFGESWQDDRSSQKTIQAVKGSSISLGADNVEIPRWDNNTKAFAGWSTEKNGTIQIYPTDSFQVSENQILYAVWSDYCAITFDANGGFIYGQQVDDSASNSDKFVENARMIVKRGVVGSKMTLPDYGCLRPGWNFEGWGFVKDGIPDIKKDTSTYIPEGDCTLYAIYLKEGQEFPSLTLNKTNLAMSPGETLSLSAVIKPEGLDQKELKWTSSNEKVVSINENGIVTAVGVGDATITVEFADGNGFGDSCKVTVSNSSISSASITGLSTRIYTGKAIVQKLTVSVDNKTLVEDVDYAISYKNNINVGTATVTITGTGNYTGTKIATFKINKAAQSISVKSSAASIAVGKTATVSITGNKGTKSYKSSDTAVATVNTAGKVTAKKVGTVTITATSAATANYNAASKAVTIKVVPAATSSITAANQATGIKLTWKKVAGATGYKVYRGATLIKTIKSGATVTYTDAKANTNGTKYTFKVVPTASTGNGLAKNLTTYRVARPAISSVKNSASKKMTVKWGKNTKANGYQIQYSTSKTFASGNKAVAVAGAATVSKVISSLIKGKTYYVRIRTYKIVGKVKYWSIWSPAKTVKITK